MKKKKEAQHKLVAKIALGPPRKFKSQYVSDLDLYLQHRRKGVGIISLSACPSKARKLPGEKSTR